MTVQLPPALQKQYQQLQQLQNDYQLIAAQRQQLGVQLEELKATLSAIEGLDDETEVYRSTGSLLVRVKDIKALSGQLAERKEETEVRFDSLQKREKKIRSTLENLEKDFRTSLQKLSP